MLALAAVQLGQTDQFAGGILDRSSGAPRLMARAGEPENGAPLHTAASENGDRWRREKEREREREREREKGERERDKNNEGMAILTE